jgi:hypothetical protein
MACRRAVCMACQFTSCSVPWSQSECQKVLAPLPWDATTALHLRVGCLSGWNDAVIGTAGAGNSVSTLGSLVFG